MRPLCVIPARLGSKRLARKNLAPLGGRPLLAWTIEAAAESGIFDEVFVSTESEEISKHARAAGATVPFLRDPALAGDTVTNVAVGLDLYDRLSGNGRTYEAIVCLQPSSPLRSGTHIATAWNKFVESGAEFLTSVTVIDPHYFHWALRANSSAIEPWFGEEFMRVRQELPNVFRPNGAIKIAKPESLRRQNTFIGRPLAGYEMPEEASVHVANALDLKLCQSIIS